jgi:Tol biopolymer transport system component
MSRTNNLSFRLIVVAVIGIVSVVACLDETSSPDATPLGPSVTTSFSLGTATVSPSASSMTSPIPTHTPRPPTTTPTTASATHTVSPTTESPLHTPIPPLMSPTAEWTLVPIDVIPKNVIAFVSDRQGQGTLDIWLIQPDGSHLQLMPRQSCIPSNARSQEIQLEWSPDGSKLALLPAATGRSEDTPLCVLDFDNENKVVFSEQISSFSWAPDGKEIAYNTLEGIWIVTLDDSDRRSLLYEIPGSRLSWAPDGLKIGFGKGKQYSGDFTGLQFIGLDGILFEDRDWDRPLGSGAGIVEDIAWSPDGRYVAVSFLASRWGGHLALFEVAERHFEFRQAIHDFHDYPDGKNYCGSQWSPDGTQIVFIEGEPFFDSECAGTIYLANADLSGVTPLLQEDGSFMSPSWSPDGHHILFAKGREVKNQEGLVTSVGPSESIWIVNSDGTDLRQLVGGDGYYYGEPVWQPPVEHP